MHKAIINLETLSCPSCLRTIESAVKDLEGVQKDSVILLFNANKLRLDFDEAHVSLTDIEATIKETGYAVKNSVVRAI